MAPYSMDLRKRVSRAWEHGLGGEAVAPCFTFWFAVGTTF